jgi:hypothetical protein
LDAVGCCFALLRRVCWPALEECYARLIHGSDNRNVANEITKSPN